MEKNDYFGASLPSPPPAVIEGQHQAGQPDSSEKADMYFDSGPSPGFFAAPEGNSPGDASDVESSPITLLGDETYPEGGLEAWLVVFGAWCGLLGALGLMNSLGTFQTYITVHQLSNYDEGPVGWIFSTYSALAFLFGVYIGPLFDKFGPRWLIFSGSISVVASMMALSVCTGRSTTTTHTSLLLTITDRLL